MTKDSKTILTEETNTQDLGVIILNKPFLGDFLNNPNNVAHEIIDFLCTDDGKTYVYNNPTGFCPKNIWVGDPKSVCRSNEEKYIAKYLVLLGGHSTKDFEITYVIKLKEKLHKEKYSKNPKKLEKSQSAIKEIIEKHNITYNGKYLYDIYGSSDSSLYLTFESEEIYKPKSPIKISLDSYVFQRNKGYLYEDKQNEDYDKLMTVIEKEGNLESITKSKLNLSSYSASSNLLNMGRAEDIESIYTTLLHEVLAYGGLFKSFCNKFKKPSIEFNESSEFDVIKEYNVHGGRIDIGAFNNKDQKVVIENKVKADFNKRQLDRYYKRATKETSLELLKPLCFITCPDCEFDRIKDALNSHFQSVSSNYDIIKYSDIADFLENQKMYIKPYYEYNHLIDDVIKAFRNRARSNIEINLEKYIYKFLLNTITSRNILDIKI